MKKIFFGLLIAIVMLSGCGNKIYQPQVIENNTKKEVMVTGTISTKSGSEYLLVTENGIINITSNKVNLDGWIKKPIRVKGMYSGSTLYVDTVELN